MREAIGRTQDLAWLVPHSATGTAVAVNKMIANRASEAIVISNIVVAIARAGTAEATAVAAAAVHPYEQDRHEDDGVRRWPMRILRARFGRTR